MWNHVAPTSFVISWACFPNASPTEQFPFKIPEWPLKIFIPLEIYYKAQIARSENQCIYSCLISFIDRLSKSVQAHWLLADSSNPEPLQKKLTTIHSNESTDDNKKMVPFWTISLSHDRHHRNQFFFIAILSCLLQHLLTHQRKWSLPQTDLITMTFTPFDRRISLVPKRYSNHAIFCWIAVK